MKLKNLCALALAVLMLLSLMACGQKDPVEEWKELEQQAQDPDESVYLAQAVGFLQLHAGAHIRIAYDQAGKVLAVVGENNTGAKIDSAYGDFSGKSCARVIRELVDLITADAGAEHQGFALVRQELGSAMPADNFIKAIEKDASANAKALPVVAVAAADCDVDGCIDSQTAIALLKLAMPDTAKLKLTCAEAPNAMIYTVLAEGGNNNVTSSYLVDGMSGQVTAGESESSTEPTEPHEAEATPEDTESEVNEDILGLTPDDGTQGADGGNDDGSVEPNDVVISENTEEEAG